MLGKDSYEISVNNAQKTVDIAVGELSSQEAAERFMNEYQAKIGGIQASEYVLHVNCENMKVVTTELAGSLEGAIGLYAQSGFQKIKFQAVVNPVLKLQLNRIARNVGLGNYEVN